jgi:TolA-binding protein
MSASRTLIWLVSLFVLSLGYESLAKAQAQTIKPADAVQTGHDRVLQQLLGEVRELRIAVQKATINHTRFEMLIERMRIEQAHVDTIARQLDNLHSQIADMRVAKPQMEQQIKDAEDLLERTTDLNGRSDLESRIKAMKMTLARFGPEDERLRSREAALDSDLQASQAKLNELNGQLDALMKETKAP